MSWQSRLLNLLLRMRRAVVKYPGQLRVMRRANLKMDNRLGGNIHQTAGLDHYSCGEIRVDRYRPPALAGQAKSKRKVLLFLHGGAYCLRSPKIYSRLMVQFCDALGCDGILPDYRLAPEHPHPYAIQDCAAVYRQLLLDGYTADNLILLGDSAGGGLTLSVLQIALAEGLSAPAAAILSSPAGDWSLSTASLYQNEDHDPMFRLASFLFFRDLYLNAHSPNDPAVSPMLGSFAGFPPMQIFASSTELLRDTAAEIANRAKAEGVKVELHIAEGLCHDWFMFGFLPEARKTRQEIIDYCQQAWALPSHEPSHAASLEQV